MRRARVLLALAAVAAALLGALTLMRLSMPKDQTAQTAPVTESYRMLYTRDRAEFARMAVTLASGETYAVVSDLLFDADGRLLGVRNALGQPVVVEGNEDFALDGTSYQMMLLTAVNLPVTASYPSLDKASCGLTSPRAVLTIEYKSGDQTVLRVGNPTASGYSCYVSMDGDDAVHLVPLDFFEVMTRPLAAHHRLPAALAREASDAVQIAVVSPTDETFMAAKQTGGILAWRVTKPFPHYGSADRIKAFIETVCAVKADAYVTSATDAETLKAYGLDSPLRLLVAFSDGAIRDIQIGKDAGEGARYARMDATGDIYLVAESELPTLPESAADALFDRYIALIAVSAADCVTVDQPGARCVLARTKDAAGETDLYTRNGSAVSKEAFSRDYAALVGMQFDKTVTTPPVGAALADVRFDLSDGGVASVRYYAYNEHYAQAVTDGGGSFLLRVERLENMLSLFREERDASMIERGDFDET